MCLTFKRPFDKYGDEIAKEFSAFLSLYSRRRVFPYKTTRVDNLPIEIDNEILYPRSHYQEKQYGAEIDIQEFDDLLRKLTKIDRRIAHSFLLATKFYHSAIEMIYTEPEFAYLFLISGIETIASAVYKNYSPSDSEIALKLLETIKRGDLKKSLSEIYKTRSKLTHEGIRFPKSIVYGLHRKVPVECLHEIRNGKLPIPPLLTFERLVSYCMIEFLRKS